MILCHFDFRRFSNVRKNFKEVCDRVMQDFDIAIITRKNNANVVLMSQSQYENIMENLYIRDSKANYEWLKDSIFATTIRTHIIITSSLRSTVLLIFCGR